MSACPYCGSTTRLVILTSRMIDGGYYDTYRCGRGHVYDSDARRAVYGVDPYAVFLSKTHKPSWLIMMLLSGDCPPQLRKYSEQALELLGIWLLPIHIYVNQDGTYRIES